MFTTGGGGVLFQCGVYNESNPSLFGETSAGLHILLRVRTISYACGCFITRADIFFTRVDTYVTYCYEKRLF